MSAVAGRTAKFLQELQLQIDDLRKTRPLLPGSIPKSLTSDTQLVLTNAIYFKGTWQTLFPKDATTDQVFHAAGGKEVKVSMMKSPSGTQFGYMETAEFQAVSLPYKGAALAGAVPNARGGVRPGPSTLSMLILLPKKVDGLAELEKQTTAANLTKWSSGLRMQPVNVYLPRFTMATELGLSKELQALGMTDAFTGAADFSGMSPSAANKLFISKVLHKAFVDVNEEGTEAAAATAVIMNLAATPMDRPAGFRADHPFLFLIRHEPTGSVLFMGRVTNPKP